jgi:peptide/nickel transport system permease protein
MRRSLAVAERVSASRVAEPVQAPLRASERWRVLRRLRRHRLAMLGLGFLGLLVLCAIAADVISPYKPLEQTMAQRLRPPSVAHWLGTDDFGRDILTRIMFGSRISLQIGFVAVGIAGSLGILLGLVSGYFGGWIDNVLSRLMDLLLAFPLLLFAIALVYVIGDQPLLGLSDNNTRIFVLVFVIGFFNWPYIGRIIRGQTLSLREKEYIEAARSIGASPSRILFREILPNLIGPILVYSTLIIPTNILFEAALSFLGVGVRPPQASWGYMLSDASQGLFQIDPEYMIVPGAALFITVIAFNLFGDGLRDALDPRSSR